MKVNPINSAQNPTLKQIRSLHQRSTREKEDLFLIEGPTVLNEAFEKGISVHDIVVSERYWTEGLTDVEQEYLTEISVVDDKLFKDLVTTQSPCGIVAVGSVQRSTIQDCLQGAGTLIAIGEAIQDPGNAGSLMRAALAFGCTGFILTKGSVDAYNPKVVRAASGALFTLPVVTNLELDSVILQLREHDVRIVALEPLADTALSEADLTGPLAILLGNEGNGLSKEALQLSDEMVLIPMSEETESLNVAICGSIVLYQCSVQRNTDAQKLPELD